MKLYFLTADLTSGMTGSRQSPVKALEFDIVGEFYDENGPMVRVKFTKKRPAGEQSTTSIPESRIGQGDISDVIICLWCHESDLEASKARVLKTALEQMKRNIDWNRSEATRLEKLVKRMSAPNQHWRSA